MNRTNRARLLAATALMAFASLAQAQYMWIDEKGIKQFSDRSPPPSIPLKNILKAPGGVPRAPALAGDQAAAAPDAVKPKAAPTLADRNADFTKRAKEKDEREQKERDEKETKAAQADTCERARLAKQSLDSGVRIGIQQKDGERGYMSDEQRVAEAKKVDKVLAGCK